MDVCGTFWLSIFGCRALFSVSQYEILCAIGKHQAGEGKKTTFLAQFTFGWLYQFTRYKDTNHLHTNSSEWLYVWGTGILWKEKNAIVGLY